MSSIASPSTDPKKKTASASPASTIAELNAIKIPPNPIKPETIGATATKKEEAPKPTATAQTQALGAIKGDQPKA